MENMMDITDAARFLGVSKSTIYTWTCKGKIAHKKIGKRILRFSKEDLEAMVLICPAQPKVETKKHKTKKSLSSESVARMVASAKKEAGVN